MAHDEENDWAGLHRCEAISRMWQGLDQIILDTDSHPGWTIILDPEAEPSQWLLWTATAIYGVSLVPGSDVEEQRARIKELPPQKRGGVEAMIAAVAQTLTGARHVVSIERLEGDAYRELVVTRTLETPDPASTLAAVKREKLAGVKQVYLTADSVLIDELVGTIDEQVGTIDHYSEVPA
jgi:hypothetical protein